MTQRDMAGYLNIDRTTLYNWKKNKPNLYKTIMLGLAVDEMIEQSQKNLDELKSLKSEFDTKNTKK